MTDWFEDASWMWYPDYEDLAKKDENSTAKIVFFRKVFELDDVSEDPVILHVSADTRYTLYVNGEKVVFGPAKSSLDQWNYETVDIQPFLRKGDNVVSLKVLRFNNDEYASSSMVRSSKPGVIVYSRIDEFFTLTSGMWWRTQIDESLKIKPVDNENDIGPVLALYENFDSSKYSNDWNKLDFDDSEWEYSNFISFDHPILPPWNLVERTIPLLTLTPKSFEFVSKINEEKDLSKDDWTNFIQKKEPIAIKPNSHIVVDIGLEKLTTGFPKLSFKKGKDSVIKILYSECYESEMGFSPFGPTRNKSNRTDSVNGLLYGEFDTLDIGDKHSDELKIYEPFWFRTFRYVQLDIQTKDEELDLVTFDFAESHYPLDIEAKLEVDNEFKPLWDISVNTLINCMHETYEDSPYYEQDQTAMDTRTEILYSYQLSRDDRLARKSINEFASSLKNGLIAAQFPVTTNFANIPQGSLYWILMVYDHMTYFGDVSYVKKLFPTIDAILNTFTGFINKDYGLVGEFPSVYWPFVDWVEEWSFVSLGIPPVSLENGIVAFNSMLFSYVLQKSSEISKFIGRNDASLEYLELSDSLNEAVTKHTFNGEFFTDGPETDELCQHSQVFAVLSGAIKGKEAKDLLERSERLGFPRCSYSFQHYVFRAFEETGIYDDYLDSLLTPWKKMISENLSTWCENEDTKRSDCNAWGSAPIFEIANVLFGIKLLSPSKVKISPKFKIIGSGSFEFPIDHQKLLKIQIILNEEKNYLLKIDLPKELNDIELVLEDKYDFVAPNDESSQLIKKSGEWIIKQK